ncbi:hypothetical protein SAMN04488137_3398 [Fictibacillus solisalsi]|uniref:Pectate lyase superfamily protein n=1 Tax=Fictibacillus solisalsi TaxID=459525 RepID=A0A1G9YFN9_9BACL|nr:hypothetical protein [Fictibacillus solisalsi]SDN07832.1 hypothetical protein SAMN04488137_3398 [Fictibacillus solisalsi]
MHKRKKWIYFFFGLGLLVTFLYYHSDKSTTDYINAEKYGANGDDLKDDTMAIQQAINESYSSEIGKVRLTGNKQYVLTSGLNVKRGVELELGQNTKILVNGNFRAFSLHKNSSITNGIIEVTDKHFHAEVIYLDGKEQFWSDTRTRVRNLTIVNSSGGHDGTGIKLFAGGANHYISFVNFEDISISGFQKGLEINVRKPNKNAAWINGNRFTHFTFDDCIRCIVINSSRSIPNESSGNQFSGLQVQITKQTEQILSVNGTHNIFEGMIWDTSLLKDASTLIDLHPHAFQTELNFNIDKKFVRDRGVENKF